MNIHIETGNIYYKNTNGNEAIFEFRKNQQDSSKGEINSELSSEGNYNDYYRSFLNDSDAYEQTKFNLLTFKKTKYLVYHFNDFLKSMSQPTIKIKHSKVTDDYIAAEKIQNQDWQYFIKHVIEVWKSKEIGSVIKISEDFLLATVENVTIAKKSYETFYNVTERNFYLTINKLPVDERDQRKDDFLREDFWWEGAVPELDSWVAFYFNHGRFPGSQKLISIPKVNLPFFF